MSQDPGTDLAAHDVALTVRYRSIVQLISSGTDYRSVVAYMTRVKRGLGRDSAALALEKYRSSPTLDSP
jgi:hypothetical protein